MTLPQGTRLGPYTILGLLGSGGMGEVYRANDTRLDRTVAIKILPGHVADSPARRQRWDREARSLSSLSHPHICALYDVGEQDGVRFIVMEHLDGDTLAQRLRRGPLSVKDVLRYAIEIVDALDHAHRQGIIHRDLKPANIMLTRTGAKLLDFGLARLVALEPVVAPAAAQPTETQTLTEEGTILGTVQYMAPEQLEAKETDGRTDIFAFGAVVYEMATGRQAFEGTSKASVMAAILEHDLPPVSAVRKQREPDAGRTEEPTPPLFDQVVTKCLAKHPAERWQSASDLKQALEWIAETRSQTGGATQAPVREWRRAHLAWLAAAALIVIAGLTTAAWMLVSSRRAASDVRKGPVYTISPPENGSFAESHAFMALSPDGHSAAFVASSGQSGYALWVRPLDSLTAHALPGTQGATQPFWSPDSRFLGFIAEGKLKKIDVSSGLSQTLAEVPAMNAAWSRDGVIVFKTVGPGGLSKVSVTGQGVTPATSLDRSLGESNHNWPQFLPDGRHFIYRAVSTQVASNGVLWVGSLDSTSRIRLLTADSHAVYAPPGYLLFMRGSTLVAQPFNAPTFSLTGEPVPVVDDQVDLNPGSHRGAFSVSDTGVLGYRAVGATELVWFDRNGRRLSALGSPSHYSSPALSPDEKRIAVGRLDPQTGASNIWLIEIPRGNASPFTVGPWVRRMPLWSPDGSRLVFRSTVPRGLYQKASSGSGGDELLLAGDAAEGVPRSAIPLDWSRDGRFLLYGRGTPRGKLGLWSLHMVGDRTSVAVVDNEFNAVQGRFSPDARWIAYVSNRSGANEVYVRPFPSGEAEWPVSVNGGVEPAWRADGKEIFYLSPGDRYLMSVTVKTGAALELGQPERLFLTQMFPGLANPGYTRNQYLVTADGQRFLINQRPGIVPASPITVVSNWPAALKQ